MMKHLRVIILPAKYLEKHISKKVLIERIRYYYFPLRTFGAGFMERVLWIQSKNMFAEKIEKR